jgi:hypothetical protein
MSITTTIDRTLRRPPVPPSKRSGGKLPLPRMIWHPALAANLELAIISSILRVKRRPLSRMVWLWSSQ